MVQVWSGHLGQLARSMGSEEDGAVRSVSLHPDGTEVAVGHHEGHIRVFHINTGTKIIAIFNIVNLVLPTLPLALIFAVIHVYVLLKLCALTMYPYKT